MIAIRKVKREDREDALLNESSSDLEESFASNVLDLEAINEVSEESGDCDEEALGPLPIDYVNKELILSEKKGAFFDIPLEATRDADKHDTWDEIDPHEESLPAPERVNQGLKNRSAW